MSNHIIYTIAGVDDIDTLINCRLAFLMDYTGPQPQQDIDRLVEFLREYYLKAIPDQTYFGCYAKSGDLVVGSGGLVMREHPGNFINPSGRMGYYISMHTEPEFRGQGICSTILKKLQDEAIKQGVTAFELHATPEGEPVYRKNGFLMHHEPTYRKYVTQQ